MKWFNQSRIVTECTPAEKERFEGLYRTFRARQWQADKTYTVEQASRERWGRDASPPFVLLSDLGMIRIGCWRNWPAVDEWPFVPPETYELEPFFCVPPLGAALADEAQSLLSEVIRAFPDKNLALCTHRDDLTLEILLVRNGFSHYATTPNGHQLMLRPHNEGNAPVTPCYVRGIPSSFTFAQSCL